MKSTKVFTIAATTGVLMAGLVVSPAYAWHPKGTIVKYVQNQTAGGAKSDANTAAQAVSAKPGDVLKYTIEVRNDGSADSKGYNDMAKTVMTDTLPEGVELVSSPSTRKITESLGLLKPGQKVAKEYLVKVTSTKNGDVVTNKACFTGDSTANDNPQSGCDNAVVKVNVPVTPTPPTPPTTPELPKTPVTPAPEQPAPAAVLPETGAANFVFPSILAALGGYGANLLRLKRATNKVQR